MNGISKPEPLRSRKAYSRRIDGANRLVYIGGENRNLTILSCKGSLWRSIKRRKPVLTVNGI